MSIRVDPDELDRAAQTYTAAGTAVTTVADTFPTTVNAGLATPALTGLLAQLAGAVAGFAQTLGATGGMLSGTADAYRRKDDEAADLLVREWTK